MSKYLRKLMTQELNSELSNIDHFVLFAYGRITAEQSHSFRGKLRENDMRVKILKNTLAAIAFEEQYGLDFRELFKGPVAFVYGGETAVDVAKIVTDWAKKNNYVTVLGGYFAGKMLDVEQVKALSKVPPKEVLLAMLAGSFEGPARQIATAMGDAMQSISNALGSLAEKLEE